MAHTSMELARPTPRTTSRPHVLSTERLDLVPITLAHVEAVLGGGPRSAFEALVDARVPPTWPNKALVERAFSASLCDIRKDPERRLWGDRFLVARSADGQARRLVGSVIFHGAPNENGVVEIGYGVEDDSRGNGYATEGVLGCMAWAFDEGVRAVEATTFPWHQSSLRVIEKVGMKRVRSAEHDMLGEMWVFSKKP